MLYPLLCPQLYPQQCHFIQSAPILLDLTLLYSNGKEFEITPDFHNISKIGRLHKALEELVS